MEKVVFVVNHRNHIDDFERFINGKDTFNDEIKVTSLDEYDESKYKDFKEI